MSAVVDLLLPGVRKLLVYIAYQLRHLILDLTHG